jgi:hypothetical protein
MESSKSEIVQSSDRSNANVLFDWCLHFAFRIARAGRWAPTLLFLIAACTGESTNQERSSNSRGDYELMRIALEGLTARYPEAADTAVGDRVLVSVYCSVVHGKPVPAEFGMFSPEGDREVRVLVLDFVQEHQDASTGLSKEERIQALWGDSWKTDVYLRPRDCNRS